MATTNRAELLQGYSVLQFKSISPFFEQGRDGEKPFDFRKWDSTDPRFLELAHLPSSCIEKWLIRFVNPATGEMFYRQLTGWRFLYKQDGNFVKPRWVALFLGERVF
jgi:gentisate 1,2-dioxygenase